jgi:hypothetical protein
VTATPAAGTYSNSVTVTLTGGTNGDEIRYTTNNTAPSATSTLYSAPITVTSTTTIRAQIFNAGLAKGQPISALYTITLPSSLILTPGTGTYPNFVAVTISGAVNGAIIRYTLDGTNPIATSTISAGQVTILSSKKLIAQAFVNGVANGQPVTGDYTITVGVPTFSPAPGTYTTAKLVTISKGANNGVIRYTLDGSDPSASSPVFSTAINVAATTTITARLFNGNTISAAATGTYTINNNVPVNGVDLVISTSTGKSVGYGVVSTTGNQIATVSVPTKRNANYSIVIKNTGSTADSYYLSSDPGQVNWKINYYTIEGTSITKAITGAGWQTPVIQPGKYYTIRLDVIPASGLLIGQSSLSLNITARAVSNATITDMVTAETLVAKYKQ